MDLSTIELILLIIATAILIAYAIIELIIIWKWFVED